MIVHMEAIFTDHVCLFGLDALLAQSKGKCDAPFYPLN